jgi:AraC-like DNA-binding protein
MENKFKYLEYEGIQIAAFIESYNQEEHAEYNPNNILFYVEQGQLNIRVGHKLYTITKGNFCVVRKFTELYYFKTWDEREGYASVNAMILQDEFIHNAIKELGYKNPLKEIKEAVVNLGNNAILLGLYKSLTLYLSENQEPDHHLMFLKTKEALLGIIQSNPDYLALFYEFSKSVKADIKAFMHHHCLSTLPLSSLAKLSGRSLSTFNRDFRKAFDTSPHHWLLNKRLNKAREILLTTTSKTSEVYQELGFKDLAHFSKTFKKKFGVSPSEIDKNNPGTF